MINKIYNNIIKHSHKSKLKNNINEFNNSNLFKTQKSYNRYKTLLKKSTRKNINSYLDNNIIGKEIINCYIPNNIKDTVNNFKILINKNINNYKFKKYENDFIPFDKSIQGKSGAIIGYLKYNPKYVVKFTYYKDKPNYNNFFNIENCLRINNNINEIFINNILNNLDLLNLFTIKEIELIKPYILEIKDCGFSDKGTYIILPLVGFECKLLDNTKKIITNLTDIFVFNHKPLLDKAIKLNNLKIITLYDTYLSLILNKYFTVLKLLQSKIEFINTDMKLNNIFISRKINNNNKFKKLKEFGFDIDFQMIISDLDKSIYKIKGIKTITIPNNPLKIKIAEKTGYGLIYHLRYKCISDFEKKCNKFKSIDYDILFIIINILIILHRNNLFTNIKNYLNNTLNIIKVKLNFDNNELKIFLNIINNNIFYKDKNVQFYLNLIITELCKKL